MLKVKNTAGRKNSIRQGLSNAIAEAIRSGVYTEKMPGVTQLAQEYSANPLTVRRALDDLAKKGLIEKRPRVGTFVKHRRRIAVLFYNNDTSRENKILQISVSGPILRGIESYADSKGVAIQIHLVSPAQKDTINKLKNDVDGFIIISAPDIKDNEFDVFSDIRWVRAMGDINTYTPSGHVTYDNAIIGSLAADQLIEQGSKEFIYLGRSDSFLYKKRLDTFRTKIEKKSSCNFHCIDVKSGTNCIKDLMKIARKELKRLFIPGVTGLFVSTDKFATPIYQVLYSIGITPVDEINIVSCNNSNYYLNGLYPRPLSVDIRMFDIGARAAEMLHSPGAELEKVVLMPNFANENIHHNIVF